MYVISSFILLQLAVLSNAFSSYRSLLPNGFAADRADSGINCAGLGHIACAGQGPRNPFGIAFANAGYEWTKELCNADSDGDGLTNGQELGDPYCLWKFREGDTGLRLTMLSHTGFQNETNSAPIDE